MGENLRQIGGWSREKQLTKTDGVKQTINCASKFKELLPGRIEEPGEENLGTGVLRIEGESSSLVKRRKDIGRQPSFVSGIEDWGLDFTCWCALTYVDLIGR